MPGLPHASPEHRRLTEQPSAGSAVAVFVVRAACQAARPTTAEPRRKPLRRTDSHACPAGRPPSSRFRSSCRRRTAHSPGLSRRLGWGTTRHTLVRAVPIHDGRWVESVVGGGVAAEEAVDGLLLVAGVGCSVTGDVDEGAEQLRVHDRQHHRACAAHGKADDAPVFRLLAGTEVRIDEWHNVFGEMIGRVAPWPQRRLTSVFAPNTLWRRCSRSITSRKSTVTACRR